jgi:AcrR family transcriptional regulator
MAKTPAGLITQKRLLSTAARMFLENGYRETGIRQISRETGVAVGCFQENFKTKEGLLLILTSAMFDGQFSAARTPRDGEAQSPVYVYALETAIQLTITEMHEHLRELYIEAYSLNDTSEYIYRHMAAELQKLFGGNFPGYTEQDFYELEIGSAGLMRSYLARQCDEEFPLEKKLRRFLEASLRIYRVSETEIAGVIDAVLSLNLFGIAEKVMQQLFSMLEMKFDFKLSKDSIG